jgi:hypothetical protein
MGQYYSDTPKTRPVHVFLNAMLEAQVNSHLPQSEFGQTYMRKFTKVGSCQHC